MGKETADGNHLNKIKREGKVSKIKPEVFKLNSGGWPR